MIKVGLVGCGGMGIMHANCYAALKDRVEVVAVADIEKDAAEKLAELLGSSEIYSSAQELMDKAEGLDLIDICLPTYLHAEYGVKAMEKGCHLFLEKPVCLNLDEANKLLEAEKRTGVSVQIGQVIRFANNYAWLKECVDEKRFGKVLSGTFMRLSLNPRWGWQNWFNDHTKSGGVALDLHIHDVDYMRYMMNGDPDEIKCYATRNSEGVLQQTYTTCRYGDAIITTESCWDYPDSFPFTAGFRVKMEKATVVSEKGKVIVYPAEGDAFEADVKKEFEGKSDAGLNISSLGAHYNEIEYLIGCLEENRKPSIAPLSEAVKSLEVALKEIESAGGIQI